MADGHLLLTFDDGYTEDRETVLSVLDPRDAVATFAVVPTWVGDEGHLDAAGLDRLRAAGCEIAAHGRRHRYLQAHRLAADAVPGDDRLAVDGPVYTDGERGVVTGDEYEVLDGNCRVAVTVEGMADADDAEGAFALAAPLDRSFRAGEAVVRPAAATLRDEIVGAREGLREYGVDPATFVFPYDAADVRAWSLATEEYDALANVATRSLPNPGGRAPTDRHRYYLETDAQTRVELEAYLDAVAERGAVGALAGHSAWETVPADRIAFVVDAARERGVELATPRALLSG